MAWRTAALTASHGQEQAIARPMDAESLAVGLRILADLLDAGLTLPRALTAFRSVAPDGWQPATRDLHAAIQEGRGLARAFEESPLRIPTLVIGLVRAGEAGGALVPAMRRAAEHAESVAATRAALRAALAYPALLAVAGVGAMGVMLGVVVPRLRVLLADLQQDLPPVTRAVLGVASTLHAAALPLLLGGIVAALAFQYWVREDEGRRAWHRWLLAIPGVGAVRWATGTAHLSAALCALLESGVTLRQAMRHAASAVGDAEIAARLHAAQRRVEAGEGIGRVFHELRVVTPLAAHLVAAGEESGRLAAMCAYAARIERSRAERLTQAGIRLVEPALILVFAGIVGVVAAAMLQAVYAVKPT